MATKKQARKTTAKRGTPRGGRGGGGHQLQGFALNATQKREIRDTLKAHQKTGQLLKSGLENWNIAEKGFQAMSKLYKFDLPAKTGQKRGGRTTAKQTRARTGRSTRTQQEGLTATA